MNDLNYVLLSGNLTRDPEVTHISPEATLCTFSIAVNRSYSDKKPSERKPEDWKTKTAFIAVETWGNVAESCARHLKKGRGVRVVGRLNQTRWNSDGMPRQKLAVIAEHVEFQPDRNRETTAVVDADEKTKMMPVDTPEVQQVPVDAVEAEDNQEVETTQF